MIQDKTISIVIPTYRSKSNLKELLERLEQTLEGIFKSYTIIIIDDCSPDESWDNIVNYSKENPNIKGYLLRRNTGQQRAILCGLEKTTCDYVVTMDDDLQQAPEDIPNMVNFLIENELDIVIAKFKQKKHSLFRRIATFIIKNFISKKVGIPTNIDMTSFRVMTGEVAKEASKISHINPVVGFLLFQVSRNIANYEVEHQARLDKDSSYNFKKLFAYFVSMFMDYTHLPLKLMSSVGAISSIGSFIASIFYFSRYLMGGIQQAGFTSLILLITFVSGLLLLSFGIIGYYLISILKSQVNYPQYSVKETTFS